MAEYAGIQIETPQEVLARLRAAREKALLNARTPEQITQININRALDLVMGNPQVKAAEQKTGAVTGAMEQASKDVKSLNLSGDESRLHKLRLIRDSLEEIDPQQALQIDQQIQQQQIRNLEVRKLNQEIGAADYSLGQLNKRYAFDPDTLQTQVFDLSTPEGFKGAQEARLQGRLVTKSEDALVNIFNAERSRQWNQRQKELDREAQKQEKALEAASGKRSIVKSRRAALQGSIEANSQLMSMYKKAAALMNDPDMLRLRGRIKNFTMSVEDFAKQPNVSQAELDAYRRLSGVIATTMGAANRLIKERSGAAVTEQEWERLKKEIPLSEDGPIKFMQKMNNIYSTIAQATRRAEAALLADDFTILADDTGTYSQDEDQLFSDQAFIDAGAVPQPQTTGNLTVQGPKPKAGTVSAQDVLKELKGGM